MKLPTKTRYAIMAMVDIAFHSDGLPIKLAQVSERQNIALNYLEQIFVKLKKAELVYSIKGPGGGYKLARKPEDISIAHILFAMSKSFQMTRCSSEFCLKDNLKCLTHNLWKGLENNIINYFSSISLSDVTKNNLINNAKFKVNIGSTAETRL